MKFLEYLRNRIFWTLDYIKGGGIKKSLKLLEEVESCDDLEKISSYQKDKLYSLMYHCINSVPFYKDIVSFNLEDWPVVDKNSFRKDKESHLSDQYTSSKLISMSTSGSTGTPFTCLQDINKKKHVQAEVLYYSSKTGYKIGQRIIFVRSLVKKVAKSPLEQFFQNIYMLDCKNLSDKGIQNLLQQIKELSHDSGAMLLCYASTLDAFRKFFEKYGYDYTKGCNIMGIVSGSEMLYDITRDSMEKAFNCKCFSRYSNEENGLIGQDDKVNNVFINNRADYIIEILDFNSNRHVEDGKIGRIVITDLFNYAMPMVRYDTGDVGSWVEINHNGMKRKAIGNFNGRAVDMIYDSYGNQISPHTITNGMWCFEGIKQFQFVQKTDSTYLMKINRGSSFNEAELLNTLYEILGEKSKIDIEIVDDIPVLASGKRRYIVNEMHLNK